MALVTWLYNDNTGTVLVVIPPEDKIILATGNAWHGPFPDAGAINRYWEANRAAHPGWKKPTGNPVDQAGNAVDVAGQKAKQAVDSATSAWTAAINTVVKLVPRVLEAAVGVVLLGIAGNVLLKQLTGVDVAGAAVRTAKQASKAAPGVGAVVR